MRKIINIGMFLVFSVLYLTTGILSAEERAPSSRMNKRYGLYLGLLGDPFPTLLGLNAAVNATDFLRATAGWGRITGGSENDRVTIDTIGFGVKLLVPGNNLSPVVGLNWAKVSFEGDLDPSDEDVQGFRASDDHFYVNAGLDWTARGGFYLAGGLNISLRGGVPLIPYLNLGAFF